MSDDLAFLFGDGPVDPPAAATRQKEVVPPVSSPHPAPPPPSAIEWVTLREAHEATSIPVATLRNWAIRGKVRARLERVGDRELRFVAHSDVLHRARILGREVEPIAGDVIVDLRGREFEKGQAGQVTEPTPLGGPPGLAPASAPEASEGSIIVPLDAWDRVLSQLGNLHEAGQQLADARERAAKAETEAQFLRERLREMRAELREAQREEPTPQLSLEEERVVGGGESLWTRWQAWRQRWIGPE